jgi:hypothetical protein
MEITVKVPDDFAAPLPPPGEDPARPALEALALQAFRERDIRRPQTGATEMLARHSLADRGKRAKRLIEFS